MVILKLKTSGADSKHWILNESDTHTHTHTQKESTEETNEEGCKEAEN